MKALLLFLLLNICQTSAYSRVSLKVTPNWSQFFEYEKIALSCEQVTSGEWTVWRYTTEGLQLSDCTSGWGTQTASKCEMKTVKRSNSGVYWCQSTHGHSSNAISITVSAFTLADDQLIKCFCGAALGCSQKQRGCAQVSQGCTNTTAGLENPVILQSPAAPVMEGDNITLLCRTKNPSNLPADFFKDNTLIKSETTSHMTIYQASKSDQGTYKCRIRGHGESPPSWLLIQDDADPPTLTPSPNSAQLFEYKKLDLSCGVHGWTVKRFTTFTEELSSCQKWGNPSSHGCTLATTKQPDSAVYWCESPTQQRSNSVNISVYAGRDNPVILQSPVLPVMKGDHVTLLCESKNALSNSPATFSKDDSIIGAEPRGNTTIFNVTKSHEGIYKCNMSAGESPSSWLFVIDPDAQASFSYKNLSSLGMLRYIFVCFPYAISTFLMVSIYRRSTGRDSRVSRTMTPPTEEDEDQQYDDVMADVTTEHNF